MLLVDAGVLYAVADRRDPNHERCVALLDEAEPPVVVPELVVTEVAYLIGDRLGPSAEVAFGRSIADGELEVHGVDPSDWARVVELADTYGDLPLGLVDASVVTLAERLGLETVASLDQRHLGVVRPRHVERLSLVP